MEQTLTLYFYTGTNVANLFYLLLYILKYFNDFTSTELGDNAWFINHCEFLL